LNLAFFGVSAGLRGFGEGPDRGRRLHGAYARQEGGRHLAFAQRLSFFLSRLRCRLLEIVVIHGRFLDSVGAVCGAD